MDNMSTNELQKWARDHLWMHNRDWQQMEQRSEPLIIVNGSGIRVEDSDGNDTGGLLTPDDIPNYARTSSTGVGQWTLQYSEGVNIPQGDDPITYQSFNTTITVSLITPSTNNPSENVTIIITKSEED